MCYFRIMCSRILAHWLLVNIISQREIYSCQIFFSLFEVLKGQLTSSRPFLFYLCTYLINILKIHIITGDYFWPIKIVFWVLVFYKLYAEVLIVIIKGFFHLFICHSVGHIKYGIKITEVTAT